LARSHRIELAETSQPGDRIMELANQAAVIENEPPVEAPAARSAEPAEQKPKVSKVPGRVIQLDFVRGIAILLVMAYHFHTVPVQNPLAHGFDFVAKRIGWAGVDLFFVLSGFLVGGLLVQELLKTDGLRIKRFLFRRMMKIWPAYYVYLLFQIAIRRHPLGSFAWQNILNVQNYAGTSLDHTWSLAVEEHFYLALPPLLLVLYRTHWLRERMVAILVGICVLVLCGRIVSTYLLHGGDPQWMTHARIDSLLWGVLLSWVFYTDRARFDRWISHRFLIALVALAGLAFTLYEGRHTPLMWSFGYTFVYLAMGALLLLGYSYEGRVTRFFLYRVVAAIGVYSYGIYLWHLSVRDPLSKICSHLPAYSQWGALLVSQYLAAIILGVVTTKAVEFPMLRLRDRLFPRGPAGLPPAHP
jgi:peptidoglycan/LPS O-acetylase OafA/YrhL